MNPPPALTELLKLVLAGLMAFLLGSCAGQSEGSPEASEEVRLRIALAILPPFKVHPFEGISQPQTLVHHPVFDSLTMLDANSVPQPRLAMEWEEVDELRWRFKLRDGVTFSNGVPFDASHVAAAVEWLLSPDGKASAVGADLVFLAGAEAVDRLTVDILLNEPNALLPRAVSVLNIPEKGAWARLGQNAFSSAPVGTGPFTLDNWASQHVSFVAAPSSWRATEFDRLEFIVLPDAISRLQAVLSGAADIALDVSPDDRKPLQEAGGRVKSRLSTSLLVLPFITTNGGPVADVRVRRAINHAIDKERIVDLLLDGQTSPVSQLASSFAVGYDEDIPDFEYSPKLARALLDEAGIAPGTVLKIQAVTGASPNDATILQQIASDLDEVGLDLQIQRITASQFLKLFYNGGWSGDLFLMSYGGYDVLRQFRYQSCVWRAPFFCDERIVKAVEEARGKPSLEDRIRATQEVLLLDHQTVSGIYLWQSVRFDGLSSRVESFPATPSHILYEGIRLAN